MDEADTPRPYVPLDMVLLEKPIERAKLETVEDFEDAEVLRQPQMGNPLIVTPEELAVVDAILHSS